MAVSTTDTYSGPYEANGVTVAFPFTFAAVSASEVSVIIRSATGDELVDRASYAVALATSGGTVTFFAPPVAGQIYVISDPSFLQQVQFESGQPFLPRSVNEVNDRSAARALVLKDGLARALQVPIGETMGALEPLEQRRGRLAMWGADGGLVSIDTLGIGNPDFQDDGVWNPDDPLIDDGVWG